MLASVIILGSFFMCDESSDMCKTLVTSRTVMDVNRNGPSQMVMKKSWKRVPNIIVYY